MRCEVSYGMSKNLQTYTKHHMHESEFCYSVEVFTEVFNTDIVIVNTRIITALVRCLILVALYSQYVSCKLLYVSFTGPSCKNGSTVKRDKLSA